MKKHSLLCGTFAGAFLLAGAALAADIEEPAEDSIIVKGQRAPANAIGGTKTDTPLIETPQSISVISRQDLDLRGVVNLNQALRYTAGITPETRGANAEVYDQFKLRGFDAPRYLDGLRIFNSPTGYADQQVDISRLDRIEVIKGPASVLYGQSSPGGLIALASKLPVAGGFYGGVEASYGTFDLFRIDADVGGQADDAGNILYRLYGSINGADTQQTFGKRRRYTISPSITLGGGGATTLTLLANYSDDPHNGNYGSVPLSGSLRPNPNGRIPQDFADGDPDLSRFKRRQASATYIFTHDFGSDWAFRSSGRYTDVKASVRGPYISGYTSDPDQAIFDRATYGSNERLKNYTMDNQLTGNIATGSVEHSLLFGVDYQRARAREAVGFGTAPPINPFDPDYSAPIPAFDLGTTYTVLQRQLGFYAQDQIALGGLRLTASGRYDIARGHLVTNFGNDDRKKDEKFTYRIGALYLTDVGVAPYVSYSTSFEPQSARVERDDGTDGIAEPSQGKQIEAGLKFQPPGTPILVTAAVFDIDQTDVVVSAPITFKSRQAGKVNSRGFEFEAKVPLFKGMDLSANYSRQKIRVKRDVNPANIGLPLIGTAKANGGLFANYTAQDGPLQGLGIGGGVRYVGRGYGGYNAAGVIYTPSYTLFDAVLSYDLGRVASRMEGVKLALNATNVFNNRHVTSCYVNGVEWCWYGQRRTVQATLGWHW
jgi:iron complex outermembrane receptor protein